MDIVGLLLVGRGVFGVFIYIVVFMDLKKGGRVSECESECVCERDLVRGICVLSLCFGRYM